jgi:hypothetical protein
MAAYAKSVNIEDRYLENLMGNKYEILADFIIEYSVSKMHRFKNILNIIFAGWQLWATVVR